MLFTWSTWKFHSYIILKSIEYSFIAYAFQTLNVAQFLCMTFSLRKFLAIFSSLPSSVSITNVQRPNVKRSISLLRNSPEYLYFIIIIAQFSNAKKFPKIFFSRFWKTCEGYTDGPLLNYHLCKICSRFKTPYEDLFCSFHLVYLHSQQMLSFCTATFLNI